MNFEQKLSEVAKKYKAEGYAVVVRPGQNDLPPFAKDFKVELVAKRSEEGVLVAVKRNRDDFAADRELSRYAEITESEPGWRFDFVILEGESPLKREVRGAQEPSEEQIVGAIDGVEALIKAGFVPQALLTAWSAFEAAMRRRIRADGESAGWGSSPGQMLNELFSGGVLSTEEFDQFSSIFRLRNQIAHGFATPYIDTHLIVCLTDASRRLVLESAAEKQST